MKPRIQPARKIDQRSWKLWEIWIYKPNYKWKVQSTKLEILMFTEMPLADSPDAMRRNRDKSITNHNTSSPNRSPRPLGALQEIKEALAGVSKVAQLPMK